MVAQYVSEKVSDLSAFIFFGILHGYVSKTYPTSIGIGYVSRYLIRYGLKYPCFIGIRICVDSNGFIDLDTSVQRVCILSGSLDAFTFSSAHTRRDGRQA
jgi:hypothetical protein